MTCSTYRDALHTTISTQRLIRHIIDDATVHAMQHQPHRLAAGVIDSRCMQYATLDTATQRMVM